MQVLMMDAQPTSGNKGITRSGCRSGEFFDTLLDVLAQQESQYVEAGMAEGVGHGFPGWVQGQAIINEDIVNINDINGHSDSHHGCSAILQAGHGPVELTTPTQGVASISGKTPEQIPIGRHVPLYHPGISPSGTSGDMAVKESHDLPVLSTVASGTTDKNAFPRAAGMSAANEQTVGNPAALQRQNAMNTHHGILNRHFVETALSNANTGTYRENLTGGTLRGTEAVRIIEPVIDATTGYRDAVKPGPIQGTFQNDVATSGTVTVLNLSRDNAPIHAANRLAEVMRVLPANHTGGHTVLSLKLEPASLGELTIRLNYIAGNLKAKFITASGYVKEIIDGAIPHLRELLSDYNIKLQDTSTIVNGEQGRRSEGYEGKGRGEQNLLGEEERNGQSKKKPEREHFQNNSGELNYLV